jgi:hypothetical protein
MAYIYNLIINTRSSQRIFTLISCRELLIDSLSASYYDSAIIELESDDPKNIYKVFSKIDGVEIYDKTISYKGDCILYSNLPLLSLLLFLTRHGLDLDESSIKKIVDMSKKTDEESEYNDDPYYMRSEDLIYTAFGLYLYLNRNKTFINIFDNINTNYNGIVTYIHRHLSFYASDFIKFIRKY